jgi:hypothetical protein
MRIVRAHPIPSAVAFVTALAFGLRGCSSSNDESQVGDASGDGDSAHDVATIDGASEHEASDAKSDSGFGCPDSNAPDDVPTSWVRLPVFGCKYPIYVPPDESMLPAPLAWEECTDIGPNPYTCRQLVNDWPNGGSMGGVPVGFVDANGDVILGIRKLQVFMEGDTQMASWMDLVAAADGPVRQAFWVSRQPTYQTPFWFRVASIAELKTTFYALEQVGSKFVREINLGGARDALAPAVLTDTPADAPESGMAFASQSFFALRGASLKIRRWDRTDLGTVYQGLDIQQPAWIGDSLIWSANIVAYGEIWAWTEEKGAYPLISVGAQDVTRAVTNAFSDGKDIVWLLGEDRDQSVSEFYPKRSIMTSKFTLDPSAIQPKRLRSWTPENIWGSDRPDAVGCGYAALQSTDMDNKPELLIVRLSDGVSWPLASPADGHWVWGKPVAVTCDEVFTTTTTAMGINHLRRVRLSSLGPGVLPD